MADIVLAIPEIIGHIHKCVEFAQAYSKVLDTFASDIEHADQITKTIRIMSDLIQGHKLLKTDREIATSLDNLRKELLELHAKLEKWKENLQCQDSELSSTLATLDSHGDVDVELGKERPLVRRGSSQDNEGSTVNVKRALLVLKWLKSKLSLRCGRPRVLKYSTAEPDEARINPSWTSPANAVVKTIRRAQFLTYVDPNIKETLRRVDRSLEDLFRLLSLSIMFSRTIFSDETRVFVEKALLRIAHQDKVSTLSIPNHLLAPLDNAFDESSEFPQSLFYVYGGEYEGCLIDRRFIRDFVNRGRSEWVKSETERVSRMMAEDLQDKYGTTSSTIPVLRSCGVAYPHIHGDFHDVVFRLPRGSQMPQTLRRALVSLSPAPNLRTRATLAFQLATALDIVHQLGVVHKRVRPESIVLVRYIGDKGVSSDGYSPSIGIPYLAGFTQARQQAVDSALKPVYGSSVPELIYHHPDLTSTSTRRAYQMEDDVYSLGICLLEVGLWRSVVLWGEEKLQYELDKRWKLDSMDYVGPDRKLPKDLNTLRMLNLVEVSNRELPLAMGPKYANIVTTCLGFGNRKEGDNSQVSGIEPIKDIVARLFELKLSF